MGTGFLEIVSTATYNIIMIMFPKYFAALLVSCLVASSLASGDSTADAVERLPADTQVDVAIVGAGISGLTAGKKLADAGYSVVVVEAMDRIGGRCYRHQVLEDTPSPLWVDEGGQWVGPTQTLWLDTLKNYNLTVENGALYESPHALGDIAVFWKNESLSAPGMCLDCLIAPRPGDAESLQPILDAAAAAPEGEFKTGLLEVVKLMEKLGAIAAKVDPAKPWLAPNAKELDNITFEEWVRNNTDSELATALSLLAVSTQGATNTEASWTSVLYVAQQLAAAPQPEAPEKWLVKNSMGQIPALLVNDIEAAGGEIIINSPVRIIQQFDDGVVVKTDNRTISAKAVIVAMPPHLAGRIQYQPPMPALRDQLTQRMFMGTIIKCIAIYDTPFWRNSTSLGNSFVFGPQSVGAVNAAFDISPPEYVGGGGVGVLASFIAIDTPEYFNLTSEEREKKVLESYVAWYGPKAATPKGYLEKVWAEEPFVGGAYSSVMPMGGWTEYGPALAAPIGRIYWAGTETSERWPGFYEGAAQAAENAVNFVKADVSPTGEYKNDTPPSPDDASPASSAMSMVHRLYMVAVSVAMIAILN